MNRLLERCITYGANITGAESVTNIGNDLYEGRIDRANIFLVEDHGINGCVAKINDGSVRFMTPGQSIKFRGVKVTATNNHGVTY